MSVLITSEDCGKLRESRTQPVRPYDGDDMINVPIDQSVLYGVWKNDDIKAVIEVSGDKPHMIVTENGKLIFGLSHPVEDSQSENHLQIESDKENQGTREDGFAASGLQLNVK